MAQSSDDTLVGFLKGEHLEVLYGNLWVQAGGKKKTILKIWEHLPVESVITTDGDDRSEWEVPAPKVHYPRPCDWRTKEFHKWKHLVTQGHRIRNFKNDTISNSWISRHNGIPQRKLLTALQLRANV